MKNRTLALAGVFQSAELVRQAANHGTWSGYAASAMMRSLFILEPKSIEDVYGDMERMKLGVEVLVSVLQGDRRHMDSLQYAIAMLKVERSLRRNKSMQETVGRELEQIGKTFHADGERSDEDARAAETAELYSRTISQLNPRIIVQGRPQHLQSERTVHWIRTLLFAGLRSAYLWEQLGGNRWRLMFGRRQILLDAQQLLAG
jgi:high frequency lysogenization protein